MKNSYELNVCCDCVTTEESDDLSSFDYYYSEREANARIKECEAGWRSLRKQGRVFNDTTDEPQLRCSECHTVHAKADVSTVYSDEWDEHQFVCPTCSSIDGMSERSSGHDEFSREGCDCCGSTLGGSRTRYALFPHDAAEQALADAGSVVHHEVAGPAG